MVKFDKNNSELSANFNVNSEEKCDNTCVKFDTNLKDKNTLIIYSSLSGNTAKIALVAAKTFGAHCYEIGEFCDKFKINLDENLEQNLKQNPAQNLANTNQTQESPAQNPTFKNSSYENLTQKLSHKSDMQDGQIGSYKQQNLNSQIGEILNQYENLAIGFWLDRGGATPKFAKFLREICGKKIALFMSCGADPQSEHSQKIIDKVASNLIAQGNEIAGKFVCQGKISDEIIAQIRAIYAQKNIEIPASRIENWEKSRSHPDENDLKNAREFFAKVFH